MKNQIRLSVFLCIALLTLSAVNTTAQKSSFDLISYSPPPGWTNMIQNDALVLKSPEKNDGFFCLITVYKTTASLGNINSDFSKAWNEIAVDRLKIEEKPSMENPESDNGWISLSGTAPVVLSGTSSVSMLTVLSDNSRTMSILVITNDQKYKDDIEAFYNNLELADPGIKSTTSSEQPLGYSGAGAMSDYIFTLPPEWKKEENANEIVLRGPDNTSVISILPFIQSSGDLDKDMNTVFWQVFSGWSQDEWNNTEHISTKGISPDGWSYFKDEMAIAKTDGDKKYTAYGFVFLAQLGNKDAMIVGSYQNKSDLLNETDHVDWQLLFHSLGFKGFKSTISPQLPKDILGSWVTGSYSGIVTYTFAPNGHFSSGSAFSTSTQVSDYSVMEKTTSFVGDGTYAVKGNILSENFSKTGKTVNSTARVFYQKQYGDWQKRLGLLSTSVVDGTLYEVTLAFQDDKK